MPTISVVASGLSAVSNTNAGTVQKSPSGIQLGSGSILSSGTGVPAIGGNIGDLYVRKDPASDATYFYRCTVAGTAGNATWAAITGA